MPISIIAPLTITIILLLIVISRYNNIMYHCCILRNYKVILRPITGHQPLQSPHLVRCMSRIFIPKLCFPEDDFGRCVKSS